MANFFPRWTNVLPLQIGIALIFLAGAVTVGVAYYFTPKYTTVGYQPAQPIPFSHKIHVDQHKMDCRYCHNHVEHSDHSNIPSSATCMNCHRNIKADSPRLAPLRESWATGQPIEWVRVHKAPDYVYFNHAVHVARGVSCVKCHGDVSKMDTVYQAQPLSMSWCLDCHRNPEQNLRPAEELLNFDWKAEDEDRNAFYTKLMEESERTPAELIQVIEDARGIRPSGADSLEALTELAEKVYGKQHMTQEEVGLQLVKAWHVNPPTDCYGCHR